MKNVLENNPITQIWRDADNLLDYTIALWITALSMLAFSGIIGLIYQLFTDPASFSNATFGIFDTLGN
jgi:hypothetical protein